MGDKRYTLYVRFSPGDYFGSRPLLTDLPYDEARRFLEHEAALGHDVMITCGDATWPQSFVRDLWATYEEIV